jgi:hypothetical protein
MFIKECVMTRLASMIVPAAFAAALLTAGSAAAGEYYERVGAHHYRPADGATYSSMCCYKKITKRITITRTVWVKVPPPSPPPKPHRHHHDDDDAVEMPRPTPHHRGPAVVELGEVVHRGDGCRKAVPVRDRGTTIIVMVNVHCR